ncbi:Tissue inhibitor of metalloproteinase [Pontibacter lucknowensis]|uniref:Tissue inhibitor of metalloproteinase n=2 Tax=Pontibacter lucknowensis TaxID=1077936 RepID=A0A1N7BHN2_9BACT|nr:Tissue inhibitor of metalloproteinase [Pontibacter lucknowensis]
MKERFQASDFVISAKVESVRDSLTKGDYVMSSDPMYWREGGYNPILKVTNVYKGELKTDIIEITPRWSNCSQYFKTGDTYIIFGYVNNKGEFATDVCSGNFSITNKERLKIFRKIRKK